MPTLDFWTIIHGLAGVAAGALGKSRAEWLAASVGWEALEQGLIVEALPSWKETPSNSLMDIAIGMLGREAGQELLEEGR